MEVLGSLVDLGVDIAPVPGLKLAYGILDLIWQSVQKASNNRKALRNLAVSSTDIFNAINHVLSKNEMNDHMRDLLAMFERVLDDIRVFAEEHVTTNLFKLLLKNVDIEGKIEFFQNRLQNLSMAFNIAAYGDISAQLGKILQGQRLLLPLPPPEAPDRRRSTGSLDAREFHQSLRVIDYEPQRVQVTYSESCQIEIRGSVPILASRYDEDMEFSKWGLGVAALTISRIPGGFEMVSAQGEGTWRWTLSGNRITSLDLNPAYLDWKDSMDIIFESNISAAAWFSCLEMYSSTSVIRPVYSQPQATLVTVRTTYHSWIQKTPNYIQHRRSTRTPWLKTLGGHSQSSQAHATHFTYVSANRVAFTKVYRSGNTIVHERCIRADNEEPTTARRFRFETEEHAKAWYTVWRNCAVDQAGENEPIRVHRTFVEPRTIQVFNREPVLASALWPEINLHQWGLRESGSSVSRTQSSFTVASMTKTWTWMQKGNQLTISTAIASIPDWSHSFQLRFRDSKSAKAWFAYLTDYGIGNIPSYLPPPGEYVTMAEATLCWMQKTGRHIQTRTALSDAWISLFGMYKSMEVYSSHLAITSTSVLPHLVILRKGRDLIQDRKASIDDPEVPVSRTYQLPSETEGRMWYEIWKENLRTRISPDI